MGNLFEYLENYGIYTFDEKPLNEVDGLILCQFVYLKYENLNIDIQSNFITMQDIYNNKDVLTYNIERRKEENKQLIESANASARFHNLTFGYFKKIFDIDHDEQYASITYQLKDNLFYIAYRGTDATLVGWKEDFNLSFSDSISSQISASNYFNEMNQIVKGNFIIGGHSKGGNLAVYTYHQNMNDNILRVDNYDGPGSICDTFHQDHEKIVKYVPKTSIIGMLMEPSKEYIVVDSNALLIEQHDPYTWMIENEHFKILDEIDATAIYIKKSIDGWLENVSDLDIRKKYIDTIYDIFSVTDAIQTKEIGEDLSNALPKIVQAYQDVDEETKQLLVDVTRQFINAGSSEMKNTVYDRFYSLKEWLDEKYIVENIEFKNSMNEKINSLKIWMDAQVNSIENYEIKNSIKNSANEKINNLKEWMNTQINETNNIDSINSMNERINNLKDWMNTQIKRED